MEPKAGKGMDLGHSGRSKYGENRGIRDKKGCLPVNK